MGNALFIVWRESAEAMLVVGVLYARRARTLRLRGTPVPLWRQWLFWTGMGLVVVSLIVARLLVSAGYGQGGAKTRASQAANGGH